jgi:hypothetical protein
VNTQTCGSLAAPAQQLAKSATLSSEASDTVSLTAAESCVYFYGGGDANTVWLANNCNTPRLVTIHWPGASPDMVQYRVTQGPNGEHVNQMRETRRRAQNGKVVSDERAHLGVSAPANVRLEERDLGGGAIVLELVNPTASMIYAEWHITTLKDGAVSSTFRGGALIRLGRKIRVGNVRQDLGEIKGAVTIAAEVEEP